MTAANSAATEPAAATLGLPLAAPVGEVVGASVPVPVTEPEATSLVVVEACSVAVLVEVTVARGLAYVMVKLAVIMERDELKEYPAPPLEAEGSTVRGAPLDVEGRDASVTERGVTGTEPVAVAVVVAVAVEDS